MIKRVSVVGLGKLGSCMAAAMAHKGLEVVGVDVSSTTVARINDGIAPVVEPNLAKLIGANRVRLHATQDWDLAVQNTDATFIVVPTPTDDNGSFSLRYVLKAAHEIGRAMASKSQYHLVVVTSTVLPGSSDYAIAPLLESVSGKRCGREFGLCYNPEFIALGNVIHDLLNPDFVLIGQSDEIAGRALEDWYRGFCDNSPPVRRMSSVNAELTKICVNTFVTAKIAFANMLAALCEKLPGGDADMVSSGVGLDSRIGSKYLRGALGYGGPCFPRDNRALAFIAQELGVSADIAEATEQMNRSVVARVVANIKHEAGSAKSIGILGLAYKPDTNVIEESQGLALVKCLIAEGFRVSVFDTQAMDQGRQALGNSCHYAASIRDCIEHSDLVVVANSCPEFKELLPEDFPRRPRPIGVFDCWRILRDKLETCSWVRYRGLGIGAPEPAARGRLADLWSDESAMQEVTPLSSTLNASGR